MVDKNTMLSKQADKTLMSPEEEFTTHSTIALGEFIERAGITEERAKEFVELGWVKPTETSAKTMLFRPVDVYKARKADKLCKDFDIPSLAGAIIVDLLEKIDTLEAKLQEKQ